MKRLTAVFLLLCGGLVQAQSTPSGLDALLNQVRESDVVGRVGGDEFAIVLANAAPEEARRKAQSLAVVIAETPFIFEGVRHLLSAAIGIHTFEGAEAAEGAEALVARADEAMYAAKHAARARLFAG